VYIKLPLMLLILTFGFNFIPKAFGDNKMLNKKELEEQFKLDSSKKKERLGNLSSLEYKVTQHDGTEQPFNNKYWDNKEAGIYVDLVSGEPLFSSLDKYDSGTGWPSFTKPIHTDLIEKKTDSKLGYERTEVRSVLGSSHLGHVFNDGPPEAGGNRYCINSASLRFIPLKDLEKEGYGTYKILFEKVKQPQGK
jgi:methionine-R-sulfoxide reductase